MGWNGEEASAAVGARIAWFENNGEFDIPEGMKNGGLLSLNDIREVRPPLCEMAIAQGLAKEGAEAEEIYAYSASDIIRIKNIRREDNLEALKALFAIGMYCFDRKSIQREADFAAIRNGKKCFIQVSYLMPS